MRTMMAALLLAMLMPAAAVERIDPARLDGFVSGGALVVDVRSPDEFAAGHVPGAINVPHERIVADPAVLDAHRDRPLVLYCRSGRRTGLALERLEQAGFERLYHLDGDMLGWEQRRLPLARGGDGDCRNC
jgi:rhodanese-related sulfurtransferase